MALTAPYLGRSETVALDEEIFGEPFHVALVHEVTRAELSARRRGTASTLTRAEVALTGAKAWRQKGTGRARAGGLSAPQRYGGGVAFGPKPRRHAVKVNRKARRRALRCALSVHSARESLAVIDPGDYQPPSTRRAAEALSGQQSSSTLVVLDRGEADCAKSFRNLPGVGVLAVEDAGVADVVGARRLVVSPAALERLSALASAPEPRGGRARTNAEEVAA